MTRTLIILGSTAVILGCAAMASQRVVVTETSPGGSFVTAAIVLPDGTFSNRTSNGQTNRTICGTLTQGAGEEFAVELTYAYESPSRHRVFRTRLSLPPLHPMEIGGSTETVQAGTGPGVDDQFTCTLELR